MDVKCVFVFILHFSFIFLKCDSYFWEQCIVTWMILSVWWLQELLCHHCSMIMFLGKIFGWTWCTICGLTTSPSLSTARTHTLAPLQPFSVKNGVQHTIATCGRALWPLMRSVPSLRLGSTIRRISIQSADGKYCYICKIEMPFCDKSQQDALLNTIIDKS